MNNEQGRMDNTATELRIGARGTMEHKYQNALRLYYLFL